MARGFDPDKHRSAWAALDFSERRRILKGVNRGRRFDDPADARLAVGAARSQMNFWRLAWLLGPLVSLIQLNRGTAEFVANLVIATLVLGAMSWFFHRRAKRAHDRNLEVVEGGGDKRKRDTPRQEPQDRDDRPKTPPGPTETFEEFRPDPNTSRDKVRRRKKRRR